MSNVIHSYMWETGGFVDMRVRKTERAQSDDIVDLHSASIMD